MECPRAGYVVLRDAWHEHVVPTVCKSWGCVSCQNRMESMYRLRTEYGCSRVECLSFITVTYEMGNRGPVGAAFAAIHLRRLWQRLRSRSRWKNVAWCRVTELTKRGQIHHHMMIGGVTGTRRCEESVASRNRDYVKWYRSPCTAAEECLNHELSREWEKITGSYVVDVSRVVSKGGLATYVAKYLSKGLAHWDTLAGLGFKRRWNCSRNWPSPGRLRLGGSQGKDHETEWDEVERTGRGLVGRKRGLGSRAREESHCENMRQVGVDMREVAKRKAKVRKIEVLMR